MNNLSILRTCLLDVLWMLRDTPIPLIIGGGYGIFLKAEHVRACGLPTLLSAWPESRSTSDLDIFLRPELLIDSVKLAPLAGAIEQLGYTVIPSARKYQFVKPGPGGIGEIKIDILTGPESRFSGTHAKADSRRVQPSPSVGIHAHPVNEAPTLETSLISIHLSGSLSQGDSYTGDVFVPHPYTYLMMKLFAFRDRFGDESKEFGRYHALDLYSIVATTTETQWNEFPSFVEQIKSDTYARQASSIVAEYFSSLTALGILRLRESHYFRPELQLSEFIDILKETFPP